MAWTPPRRVISTATSVTVSGLPTWLPDKGYWSDPIGGSRPASLNTADSIKGQFLPLFTSTRNFWRLWNDYSGAVWNPHMGTNGAMLFGPGGGHTESIGQAGCDNGVYAWSADTRQWSRLSDCSYPGMLSDSDWSYLKDYPWDSDLMNSYGEVATGVPASNHSRSVPCIIPPTWGGTQGSLCMPFLASLGKTGNYNRAQAHKLDCASALSMGSSAASQAGGAWSRLGAYNTVSTRGWAATVDTNRGYVYLSNSASSYDLSRLNLNTNIWSDATPSGYSPTWSGKTIQYAAELDMLIQMDRSLNLLLMPAGGSPLAMTTKVTQNKFTLGYDEFDTSGTGFVWCKDLPPYGAIVHFNTPAQENVPATQDSSLIKVYACYAPANPLTQDWTWSELISLNKPTSLFRATQYINNYLWYNKFQYSSRLKSFFLCSQPDDAYGGIVCFRPQEIP